VRIYCAYSFISRSGKTLFEPVVQTEPANIHAAGHRGISRFIGSVAQFGAEHAEFCGSVIPAEPFLADRDLENAELLRGNIAIVGRGEVPFGEKARRAQKAGCAAVLIVNDRPGRELAILGTPADDDIMIPVIGIGHSDAESLRADDGTSPAVLSISYKAPSAELAKSTVVAAGNADRGTDEWRAHFAWERRGLLKLVQRDMRRHWSLHRHSGAPPATLVDGIAHKSTTSPGPGSTPHRRAEPYEAADLQSAGFSDWMHLSEWPRPAAGRMDPVWTLWTRPACSCWRDIWNSGAEFSATEIQAHTRRCLAERRVERLRLVIQHMAALRHAHMERAAVKIQTQYRILSSSKYTMRLRERQNKEERLTSDETKTIAEKTALMMCLNAEIEREQSKTTREKVAQSAPLLVASAAASSWYPAFGMLTLADGAAYLGDMMPQSVTDLTKQFW
jgi:hypothetical protein